MARSVKFYVDQLGFQNAQWGTDEFTSVNRDTAGIYLCRQNQGRGGAWAWIGVEDVEALHAEYRSRGVVIAQPPTTTPGPSKCESKIPTATSSVWVRNPARPQSASVICSRDGS